MTSAPVRRVLRRSLAEVHHITPVPHSAATGLVADVYAQLERDFGILAPPVALHSPDPDLLAASWMMLRETLVAQGAAARTDKESVAAGISRANTCPYCVEVHNATLEGLGAYRTEPSPTATWAGSGGAADTVPASGPEAAELLAVALTFHYVNRVVHVFLDDSPLPVAVPARLGGVVRRVLGRMLRGPAAVVPGGSLDLLPGAELPPDLAWAAASPTVATALARSVAAIEAAGDRALPASVRELVVSQVAAWDGRPPAITADPGAVATDRLSGGAAASARLALLVAMAPYRVDAASVLAAQLVLDGDADLLALVSWASLTAARRIVRGAGDHLPTTTKDTASAVSETGV